MVFEIEKKKTKSKGGFIGMNILAAKAHHIPFHHKNPHTIEVYVKVPRIVQKTTAKHEEIELLLMERGLSYHKAHQIALSHETDKKSARKIIEGLTFKSNEFGGVF